jgi:hypothetical protein
MYVEFSRSPRGFPRVNFTDALGNVCSIEQSDIATSGVIVIACEGDRRRHMCADTGRMILSREHVAALMPILSGFLLTGTL